MASRVLVAMSGGVDSSVAAARVAQAGFEAAGVTLKLLERMDTGFGCCGSPRDVEDAKRVCEKLGIPHYTVDLAGLFETRVIRPFVEEYAGGRTPNPCVECNRAVKFGHFSALAKAWKADYVATGHYARVEGGRLLAAKDSSRDQSYFLYSLTPEDLSRTLFPVGELSKGEVRSLARALGLGTADKPDSQEVCFVPRRDYRSFVRNRRGHAGTPGPIVNLSGERLGTHRGLSDHTVGQRSGLGLSSTVPLYVLRMEASSHTLVVGRREEGWVRGLRLERVSWTRGGPPGTLGRVRVVVRYRHPGAWAGVELLKAVQVRFETPQPPMATGQSAVFYSGDEVLGGGIISEVSL